MIKQPVSAGFGFIVPEEELEAHLEDKEGTVYFRQTDIDCETMPKLNTKSYYYEVIYTPYILYGKACAKDVKIGAGHPYPEKKSNAPVAVTAVTKRLFQRHCRLRNIWKRRRRAMRGLLRSSELFPSTTGIMR